MRFSKETVPFQKLALVKWCFFHSWFPTPDPPNRSDYMMWLYHVLDVIWLYHVLDLLKIYISLLLPFPSSLQLRLSKYDRHTNQLSNYVRHFIFFFNDTPSSEIYTTVTISYNSLIPCHFFLVIPAHILSQIALSQAIHTLSYESIIYSLLSG